MIRLFNQNITQTSKINHRFDDTISFWYYNHDDRQSYYFKECDSFSAFKEVLVSRLITSLHYPCVKYQMATFIDQKIYNGVVSPNFIKPNTKYYSGSEILYNYYYGSDTPAMMVNPNSLESIWFALENRYFFHPLQKEIVADLMNQITTIFILNIIFCNSDCHEDNWGILESDHGPSIAPMFDFSLTFSKIPYTRLSVRENKASSTFYEEAKYFLEVSDITYMQQFQKIYEALNPKNVLNEINFLAKESHNSLSSVKLKAIIIAYQNNYQILSSLFKKQERNTNGRKIHYN